MCEELDEFRELASSAGAEAVTVITAARKTPDARYFIGSGKAEEIRACVESMKADVVLFNHELSPGQERGLIVGFFHTFGVWLDASGTAARRYRPARPG